MPTPRCNTPLIVALDYPDAAAALDLADRLDPALCRLKVGNELFTRAGPAAVEALAGRGFEVFLDLKFHDIPNTVAGAVRAAAALGVWMVNVHAGGGRAMLDAARDALAALAQPPLLIGVTVLTSLDAAALGELGLNVAPGEHACRLAELAAAAGLDGVVCSPREVPMLRLQRGDDFVLVTPGIRWSAAAAAPGGVHSGAGVAASAGDDQRRVATPAAALAAGSSYLVIGRPVTAAADPAATLRALAAEFGG